MTKRSIHAAVAAVRFDARLFEAWLFEACLSQGKKIQTCNGKSSKFWFNTSKSNPKLSSLLLETHEVYVGMVWQLFLYNKMREIFPEKKQSVGPISHKTWSLWRKFLWLMHGKLWSLGNTTSCSKLSPAKTTESGNELAELSNRLQNLLRNNLKYEVYGLKHTRWTLQHVSYAVQGMWEVSPEKKQ